MSYQKDRDEFIGVIVEEVTKAPKSPHDATNGHWRTNIGVKLARLILRNAAIIQRVAVTQCNRELTEGEKKQDFTACDRVTAACFPWGIVPRFSGDPRGCVVKLILPSGRWNSFGGAEDGYCVPTR